MKLATRILVTALAFVVGVMLMWTMPFLSAWAIWGETDEDGENNQ